MQLVSEFFAEIDALWPEGQGKIRLSIIGCGALMLQADYERGTKDSDIFETIDLARETKEHLVRIAGEGTDLHYRWKLYIDIVANGVPFLPHAPLWHLVQDLNPALEQLRAVRTGHRRCRGQQAQALPRERSDRHRRDDRPRAGASHSAHRAVSSCGE